MIKLGVYNNLHIARFVDFGAYLSDDEGNEVLLPARYVAPNSAVGDPIDVFVYNDSEERPVAVTDKPYAQVGEFAFMKVADVNKYGAFLDWGVPKHILVPFSEQKVRMEQGGIYPVYIYIDHNTNRIVASAKLEKFLGNVIPDYHIGQKVTALIWQHTDLGYKVIVDNLFYGMIYDNEIYTPLEIGQTATACVKHIRDDGKIDLTIGDRAGVRVAEIAGEILAHIKNEGGRITITDTSSPEEIKAIFNCSKKDYKKAIGKLYREHTILLGDGFITLT